MGSCRERQLTRGWGSQLLHQEGHVQAARDVSYATTLCVHSLSVMEPATQLTLALSLQRLRRRLSR